MCLCVSVCVCECVCERERERDSACVTLCFSTQIMVSPKIFTSGNVYQDKLSASEKNNSFSVLKKKKLVT